MATNTIEKPSIETEKKFIYSGDHYSWNYYKRTFDFMADFEDETAKKFINFTRNMQGEFKNGENNDITLYINSRGGLVTSLLAMIDAMKLVSNDFVTVGIGQCASCGAVLLSAGTKGKRYITENARVLIHQVSGGAIGKTSEIVADVKEAERLNEVLMTMLAKNCGKTIEELKQLTLGGDLILNAEQAVEFGIVDAILTKDVAKKICDMQTDYNAVNLNEEAKAVGELSLQAKQHDDLVQSAMKLEIKAVNSDDKFIYINGLASTPDKDRVGDIVEQEALMDSIRRIGLPAFIHQHKLSDMPLGIVTEVNKAGKDTAVKLKMPKNEYTEQIKGLIEIGAYGGLSIGYVVKDYEFDADGYRIIKDLDWYEVSLVTVPANPNAKILEVKQNDLMHKKNNYDILNNIKNIRDVEKLLCDLGCSKSEAGYVIKVVKNSASSEQGEPASENGSKGEPSDQEAVNYLQDILTTLNDFKV